MFVNYKNYLFLYLFALALLVPALDRKLHFLPVYEATEKRELAMRPNYNLSTPIQETFKSFEAFWNDNFGGRSFLIKLRTNLWIKLFRESPIPYVTIGQNGWLFYKSEAKDDGPGINDYQGLTPLSDREVSEIIGSIVEVKHDLARRGIDLIITVAPNKSTIYPDQLPGYIRQLNPLSRLDQLVSAMPDEIKLVDLRPILHRGRSVYPTYQTTDSHWNNYGAYLATTELLKAMPNNYKIKPYVLDDYNIESKQIMGEGDLSSMMSARGIFSDLWISLVLKNETPLLPVKFSTDQDQYVITEYSQKSSKQLSLALFGDSFGEYLGPFLSPHFAHTQIISFSNNYKLNDSLIDQADPDIIIWEVAERYVDRFKQ